MYERKRESSRYEPGARVLHVQIQFLFLSLPNVTLFVSTQKESERGASTLNFILLCVYVCLHTS